MPKINQTCLVLLLFLLADGKCDPLIAIIKGFNIVGKVCVSTSPSASIKSSEVVKKLSSKNLQSFVSGDIYATMAKCKNKNIIFLSSEMVEDIDVNQDDFVKAPLVILTSDPDRWRDSLMDKVNLNQLVYVIDETSGAIYETYHVEDKPVWRKIGRLTDTGIDFATSSIAVDRRTDFLGMHMKVMVSNQVPYNRVPTNYPDVAPFHENNSTYDVTDIVTGIFRQILDTMSLRLNFTYSLYQRKDGWWATPVEDENGKYIYKNASSYKRKQFYWIFAGTVVWKGMAENVLSGEAHLIGASLTVTPERASVLDFLPTLGLEDYMLFIVDSGVEEISWTTYTVQFTPGLWTAVGIMSISLGLILISIDFITIKDYVPSLGVRIIKS